MKRYEPWRMLAREACILFGSLALGLTAGAAYCLVAFR